MTSVKRQFVLAGCLFAFLAVGLGAFGAHALKHSLDPRMLQVFNTAVEYQMTHALGLILTGILCVQQKDDLWGRLAGYFMIAGIILFSGSLYLLSVFKLSGFGIITPIGGMAFLLGWLSLAVSVLRGS